MMPNPQDRRPDETSKAYAAFVEYLRLGSERSIDQAAKNLGKGTATLRKWSERHGWVGRAAAYDELCVVQEREVQAVLAKDRAAEWAGRQIELKEAEWAAAKEAIALGRELMAKMSVKATLGDVAKLLDVASKLGRLATGMETDRKEVTGKDGDAIKVEVDLTPALRRVYGVQPASTGRLHEQTPAGVEEGRGALKEKGNAGVTVIDVKEE